MTKNVTLIGAAIALIAGFLLVVSPISSLAFDEKNPNSVLEQLENQQLQNPNQKSPYQNIPQQQNTNAYPSHRLGNKPGAKKGFKWVDDGYYGNCATGSTTQEWGRVWHKKFDDGGTSNPYFDKIKLCRGAAGNGGHDSLNPLITKEFKVSQPVL